MAFLLPVLLIALALPSWVLEPPTVSGSTLPDSSQLLATVEAVHRALKMGDQDRAMDFLSAEAVIAENGRAETRSQIGVCRPAPGGRYGLRPLFTGQHPSSMRSWITNREGRRTFPPRSPQHTGRES